MRRNQFVTVVNTVAGKTVEHESYLEQYDGRLTVATVGFEPLVFDLTVAEATRAYDVLAQQDDDRRQAEHIAGEAHGSLAARGIL